MRHFCPIVEPSGRVPPRGGTGSRQCLCWTPSSTISSRYRPTLSHGKLGPALRFARARPFPVFRQTDVLSVRRHVPKAQQTDMSIDAATPAAKDRRGVTDPLGPIYSGFDVPSATPQHGNFSLRAAAISLRQAESPPRFGGLPVSVQMLIS